MEIQEILANLPTLETERLLLRKMRLEDAEDLFEYASDPEVAKYTTWVTHESLADSQRFLNFILERYPRGEFADWGIIHKTDRKFIGTCGFAEWAIFPNCAEVGYALSRKYWGKGYVPEAVWKLLNFGFETLNLHRIEARCKVENIASARVMEKVGMKFQGIFPQQMYVKGEYWDLKVYSILRQEFLELLNPSRKPN